MDGLEWQLDWAVRDHEEMGAKVVAASSQMIVRVTVKYGHKEQDQLFNPYKQSRLINLCTFTEISNYHVPGLGAVPKATR